MKNFDQQERLSTDEMLSAATAAAIAERSVRTIRRAYASGQLAAYRDGGGRRIRILRIDLRDWMMREKVEPQEPGGQAAASQARPIPEQRPSGSSGENLALLRAARARSS
jgi:excisionase family DNA binding protein